MDAELKGIEVERAALDDDDLTVKYALSRQLRFYGIEQLREVTVQRFLFAALEEYLVAVAKDQRAKSVPLRLEYPVAPRGISSTRLASIGRTGGLTGRSTPHGISGVAHSYRECC